MRYKSTLTMAAVLMALILGPSEPAAATPANSKQALKKLKADTCTSDCWTSGLPAVALYVVFQVQVVQAIGIGPEPSLELACRPRVVFASAGEVRGRILHDQSG